MAEEIAKQTKEQAQVAPVVEPVSYLSEPAKEAKMAELENGDILKLALAAATGNVVPVTTIENAAIQLPIAETLLAAGKVMTDRARKEWKEDAEAHDLTKVDYPEQGMRIQIIKSARAPQMTPEALLALRKSDPILFSQIAKPGIHAPASKKAEVDAKIEKLQAQLIKLQAEKEAYDLYDEPQLIDDDKAVAKAVEGKEVPGMEWKAKRADTVREGSIPKKR